MIKIKVKNIFVCFLAITLVISVLASCTKDTDIDLNSKRRYRCVAEYLLRQEELVKVRDSNGKLVKKIGNAGKPVVLYRGLDKLHNTLKNSDQKHKPKVGSMLRLMP